MPGLDPCLIRSCDAAGELVVRVGVPLADEYLEFLAGRSRPNSVLAAGYDLRVFFAVVGKAPQDVVPADVLAFITAQRTGRACAAGPVRALDLEEERAGLSTSTVRRPLSTVSGSSRSCTPAATCRPTRCCAACRHVGSGPDPARASRWCAPRGGCRGSWRRRRLTR
jgi:hypothetical protein